MNSLSAWAGRRQRAVITVLRVVVALLFCLAFWTAVVVIVLALCGQFAHAQTLPLATPMDQALAPLAISADGRVVTFRGAARDTLQVCAEPATGRFAAAHCYSLQDLRRGLVRK